MKDGTSQGRVEAEFELHRITVFIIFKIIVLEQDFTVFIVDQPRRITVFIIAKIIMLEREFTMFIVDRPRR